MSRLIQWLDHRREVVGLETWKELAEDSGLPPDALHDVQVMQSVQVLERSQRRWLAAALRVSLRKLEELDCGEIDWIDDDHVVDIDVQGRPRPGREDDPAYWASRETRADESGTPLVGRIRANGAAEPDEDWHQEWGRRLPARFGKGRDIYALEIEGVGQFFVFRNVPPWEFREGAAAIYCWNGYEARGVFGHVQLAAFTAVVVTLDGQRHHLDPANVVRIGKIIGRWPAEARRS
jgi:hypothetical protein